MIDFRYHLVSIVSIFLALAVGIVLGAGPLQQQIGTTLTSEVTQLREEKAELRAQVDALSAQEKAHDEFDAETLPRVVASTLIGQSVTVVALPGTDQSLVDRTATTVQHGGATLTHRLSVTPKWVSQDPADKTARTQAAQAGATKLALTPSAGSTTPVSLDQVLAAAVFGGVGTPDDPAVRRAVIADLVAAGLVETDDTSGATSTSAVIVAGVLTDGSQAEQTDAARRWLDLVSTLRTHSTGIVVASDLQDEPTDSVSVLSTLRTTDKVRAQVSGVDNAATTIGQASIDFALAAQIVGRSGQYGTQSGVDGPYAPVPAS